MVINMQMRMLTGLTLTLGASCVSLAEGDTPWHTYWNESSDSNALCRGSYQIPAPETGGDAVWMTLSGKELEYEPEEGAEVSGGVRVQFGPRVFEADTASAPQGMNPIQFEGNVRYFEPGAAIWGERASYEAQSETVKLESLQFLLEDRVFSPEVASTLPAVRGEAERIALSEGEVLIENAWFTRCEPKSAGWEVSSKSLAMSSEDAFATVTNARLAVADLPVLYVPWMKFPITSQRQTGWLYPDLRYEGERGGVVRLPFYWNLAPNRDLVVIPGFEGRRGGSLGLEYRHATKHTNNRLIGHYFPDDEEFVDDHPDEDGNRYLVRARHSGRFGNILTSANLTFLSDRRMHRERYEELGLSHTRWGGPSVTNEGRIIYQQPNWQLGVEMEHYRIDWNPNPDVYRTVPKIFFNGEKRFGGRLLANFHTSWSRFTNDITEREFGEVSRWSNDLRFDLPMRKPWGEVTASFGGAHIAFELHEARQGQTTWNDDEDSELQSGFFELDGSLNFERRGEKTRVSLEPRALYTYRRSDELPGAPLLDSVINEYSLTQLFSSRRYAGTDRYADIHQVAVGLRSRIWNQDTGRRVFEIEAGVIRSLEDEGSTFARLDSEEDVTPLAVRARSWLSEQVRVESAFIWHPDGDRWFERGFWASYRSADALVLRIGYRMRRYSEVFDQGEVAFSVPVSERLRLFGMYSHDFSQSELLTAVFGASYRHCCWAVDLGVRRLLRRPNNALVEGAYHSNAVYLNVIFRGFTGVGDSIAPLLSQIGGPRNGW